VAAKKAKKKVTKKNSTKPSKRGRVGASRGTSGKSAAAGKKDATRAAQSSRAPSPQHRAKKSDRGGSKGVPARRKSGQRASPVSSQAKNGASGRSLEQWAGFFQPLDDRILIEMPSAETLTAGGLFLVTSETSPQRRARVLAVGNGPRDKKGRRRPLDVQPGDLVLCAELSGSTVRMLDSDVMIIKESDVLGIVE
jgi:chaperonin GroES